MSEPIHCVEVRPVTLPLIIDSFMIARLHQGPDVVRHAQTYRGGMGRAA